MASRGARAGAEDIAEEVRGRLGEFTPTVTYLVGTHKLENPKNMCKGRWSVC